MPDSFAVYVARRALAVAAVSVTLSALTFVMLRLLTPESFGDTRPLLVQLAHYLDGVFLHADFGVSEQRPFLPVRQLLVEALPADIALLVGSMAAGLALGVAGGTVCARRPGTFVSRLLETAAAVALCAPVYFVGLLSILLFAPAIDAPLPLFFVLPNSYRGLTEDPLAWLGALFVPWLVAGLPLAAMCLRMIRATLPEVVAEDFVRTAVAKGLAPRRISLVHTLPVTLPPTLSLAGAYVPMLITNVILVEAVFGIPGVWRLIPGALDTHNFPVLQAIVIVGAIFVAVSSAIVDIVLAALDPRVRA